MGGAEVQTGAIDVAYHTPAWRGLVIQQPRRRKTSPGCDFQTNLTDVTEDVRGVWLEPWDTGSDSTSITHLTLGAIDYESRVQVLE